MVSCNLVGRMANQQFIIAATIAYALRHGLEYHIPAHTLNDSVWKPMFTHLENPKWNPLLPTINVRENGHQYQEIGTFSFQEGQSINDFNIIIDGYRQSLLYFEDYLPEVRKAFGFDYKTNTGTVGVHWRMGDYRMYPTKHPLCTYFYMIQAIREHEVMNGKTEFIFFSDEIDECKKFVDKYRKGSFLNKTNFYFSENKTEKEDFQSLLDCEGFVISNSTFSLMASILSTSPNKVVVSPDEKCWFGEDNSHLDVSDLIPKEYIRINHL